MMPIRSYSKVFNIGHPQIGEIFSDEVIVEEKVDGSQFSFGVFDGVPFCRSNGKEQWEMTDKLFFRGREVLVDKIEILHPNWTYRGEYLEKPKHNTLCYERVPKDNIIIFDIDTTGETAYLTYEEKKAEAERVGFETVPLLYRGIISTFEDMMSLMENESILGGVPIEGFVVKNYNRWTRDGKTMMGKFVSEMFKEKHDKDWKSRNPHQKSFIELIIAEYTTEARWQKCVQHLRENGEIEDDPRDIGKLFRELQVDFEEECAEEIGIRLWNHFKKSILKGVGRGLPQWYKEKLAKTAFETYEDDGEGPHTV